MLQVGMRRRGHKRAEVCQHNTTSLMVTMVISPTIVLCKVPTFVCCCFQAVLLIFIQPPEGLVKFQINICQDCHSFLGFPETTSSMDVWLRKPEAAVGRQSLAQHCSKANVAVLF